MKIEIDRHHFDAMRKQFPRLSAFEEQLLFGDKVELLFHRLESPEVEFLTGLYRRGGPQFAPRVAQLSGLQQALVGGGRRFRPEQLEEVLPAIADYLLLDGVRGWLFSASVSQRALPYLITRVDYTPASNDEIGKVFVELKANARGGVVSVSLRITASDIADKTIGELFAAKGFLKETTELVRDYDETQARYLDWRARCGAQFSGQGTAFYAEDPSASHREVDWSRKDIVVLSSGGTPARLVNDESMLTNRSFVLDASGDVFGQYLRKAKKSDRYGSEEEMQRSQAAVPKGMFTKLPVHPYILMFHLELHHYLWVHVADLLPYAYRSDLKEKLVLPDEQIDLIDILTAEMDVLMDDIVAGKSGGTTVLCAGPPGVGKTLTAEIYSEIIQRPLYRVHSGQLGMNVAAMEAALKHALMRAQRWGAVMLIDEADVYIKRRDDDMTMNAVVGVFLRVLEYFNGLLFLTTNRVDDIDEAIVSRCIALIKYSPPDARARARIWEVMLAQFALGVEPGQVEQLVTLFPSATGRDIKGLVKLVSKYCRHRGAAPSLAVFKRCSIFRGMEQLHTSSAATAARVGSALDQ